MRPRPIWLTLDDDPELQPANWRTSMPTPEEQAMRHEHRADLQAALNTLPPQDRSVLIMRYWYDLSYDEIAEATASTVSPVKSRLHRAGNALAPLVRPAVARPPASAQTPQRAALALPCPAA